MGWPAPVRVGNDTDWSHVETGGTVACATKTDQTLWCWGDNYGGATGLGVLFGLPIDIRHIAFSSAYLGYAAAALDFSIPATTAAIAFAGVLLIGVTNLLVSFALTLSVAMRARRITFAQSRSLGGLLLRRLLRAPHAFLFPPRAGEPALGPTSPNS